MRYYIATRLENHAAHNVVRDALQVAGHQITYDWTVHGPVWRDGEARIRQVSELEAQGVVDADIVIVLLPGGRGTHAELGIALGAGKPVLLVCDAEDVGAEMLGAVPGTCAFYHHPNVLAVTAALDQVPGLAETALAAWRSRRDEVGFTAAPAHYAGPRETIDEIRDAIGDAGFISFCHGNYLKYKARAGKKGAAETDLEKARWYLEMASHVAYGEPDPRTYRGRP